MSANCNFDQHINNVFKQCSRLSGWILRTFISRDATTMLTLFKCVVLSRLDYGSQLWSPTQIKSLNKIERVQRSFTKFITGMRPLSYEDRLKSFHLYSVQRRFERYTIIYIWKILESMVPNLLQPITYHFSDRRGRLCYSDHVSSGRIGNFRLPLVIFANIIFSIKKIRQSYIKTRLFFYFIYNFLAYSINKFTIQYIIFVQMEELIGIYSSGEI